jgi:hypothetical protein
MDAALREAPKEAAPYAKAARVGPYIQVLEIDPVATDEGREVVEPQRKADRLAQNRAASISTAVATAACANRS